MRFGDFILLKMVQSEWQRAFWPISTEQDFYQTQIMYRNRANNKNFHYRTNSVKLKDNFRKALFLVQF